MNFNSILDSAFDLLEKSINSRSKVAHEKMQNALRIKEMEGSAREKLQELINQGVLDKQELINQGMLTKQELENAGLRDRAEIAAGAERDKAKINARAKLATDTHVVDTFDPTTGLKNGSELQNMHIQQHSPGGEIFEDSDMESILTLASGKGASGGKARGGRLPSGSGYITVGGKTTGVSNNQILPRKGAAKKAIQDQGGRVVTADHNVGAGTHITTPTLPGSGTNPGIGPRIPTGMIGGGGGVGLPATVLPNPYTLKGSVMDNYHPTDNPYPTGPIPGTPAATPSPSIKAKPITQESLKAMKGSGVNDAREMIGSLWNMGSQSRDNWQKIGQYGKKKNQFQAGL